MAIKRGVILTILLTQRHITLLFSLYNLTEYATLEESTAAAQPCPMPVLEQAPGECSSILTVKLRI